MAKLSYGWSPVELHDKKEKKEKKKKKRLEHYSQIGYEGILKNKSYHSFKLHTYTLLMSCLVGKKKPKKVPFLQATYI